MQKLKFIIPTFVLGIFLNIYLLVLEESNLKAQSFEPAKAWGEDDAAWKPVKKEAQFNPFGATQAAFKKEESLEKALDTAPVLDVEWQPTEELEEFDPYGELESALRADIDRQESQLLDFELGEEQTVKY